MIGWLRTLALLRDPQAYGALAELIEMRRVRARVLKASPGVKFSSGVRCIAYSPEHLQLQPGVSIGHGTVLACGDPQNGYGRIVVGRDSWIGEYNNLRAHADADIVVGERCLISQYCTLVGSNHGNERGQPIRAQGPDRRRLGVTLGADVWLGAGVVVCPGVRIGDGVIIGANAVVNRDVPAYEIWAGVPAKHVAERP